MKPHTYANTKAFVKDSVDYNRWFRGEVDKIKVSDRSQFDYSGVPTKKARFKGIAQIDTVTGETIEVFGNYAQAHSATGVSAGNIHSAVNNSTPEKKRIAGGFHWEGIA